jgi:uncharacterized protein
MIKADREYRSFTIQKRDDEEANKYIVEGYASTFDRYPLLEMDGETYYEQIDRHAFDETDMSDVVFLLDHTGRVYARTKNNSVELSIDDKGLWTRTDLSRTESARQVAEDIEVGNYSQMSFAFIVDEDHFDRKTKTRCIDKVKKVFDISAVGFPANPYTNIGVSMRDYFNGEIELEKAERLEAEKRQRELDKLKLKLRLMEETL